MLEYDAFSTPFILLNEEPMYHVDLEKLTKYLISNCSI